MYEFDYVRRIRGLQEKMKSEDVVCCIVMRPGNIRYLTGFWGYATRAEYSEPRRLIALIVPANGQPLLVAPKIESEFARRATDGLPIHVRRHVEWREDDETEDSWGIARAYLKELGLSSGKLGFERQHLTSRA